MIDFTMQYASNCLVICYTLQDDLTHFRNRQQRFMSTTNYRDEETKGGMKPTLVNYNIENNVIAY